MHLAKACEKKRFAGLRGTDGRCSLPAFSMVQGPRAGLIFVRRVGSGTEMEVSMEMEKEMEMSLGAPARNETMGTYSTALKT
jgi:hypothetical protein